MYPGTVTEQDYEQKKVKLEGREGAHAAGEECRSRRKRRCRRNMLVETGEQ